MRLAASLGMGGCFFMADAFVAVALAVAGETGSCFVWDAAGEPGFRLGLFLGVAAGRFMAMDQRLKGVAAAEKGGDGDAQERLQKFGF